VKLALVHDWLNQLGGAEDVLEALVKLYPDTPLYTSVYAPDLMKPFYREWDIRTLWLDRMPGIHRHHQPYLPLYPLAWGGLNLSQYDVVLSNKSGFCHGFQHGPDTLHICYCLAPTRYVWQLDAYIAREGLGKPAQMALRPLVEALKRWDYAAASRVHHFIAISTEIQERIKTYYNRDSVIIYPPVDTLRFQPTTQTEDYFLVVSRLIPYKRIDLAVQAATRLGLPLKVGGKGRDLERLKAMAGPTVEFLGYVPDDQLPDLMARCKAFLFPGLEDFGITPVQAEAAGRPVIAYGGGGALDTVIPGVTGEHFRDMTVDSLAEVMAKFDAGHYNPTAIRAHALQFDTGVFNRQMTGFVDEAWAAFQEKKPFVWHNSGRDDSTRQEASWN
jgi:glycosyltransferase involved in cell wall biosynthesis